MPAGTQAAVSTAAAALTESGSSSGPLHVAAAAAPATERLRALRATVVDSTGNILFDWAERTYPTLFPGHSENRLASPYLYRHYPATGIYVGISGSDVYVQGGSFGTRPTRVGKVQAYWSQAVTKAPESRCWNLDLMFTEGTLVEVEWAQTGPNAWPLGTESLQTIASVSWAGEPGIEFWRHFEHRDTAGRAFGRQSRVIMRRTGIDEVIWMSESYNESEVVPNVGVRNQVIGIDDARPARVDRHFSLTPGQASTTAYTLARMITIPGATPAQTQTTHHSESHSVTTRVVARESLVVPAGRYDTCRVEQTDSAMPGRAVTTWYATGRGIPVQRVTVEGGVTTLTQRATAVKVNHKQV